MNVAKAYFEILLETVVSCFVVVSCGNMGRDSIRKREIPHITNMLVNGVLPKINSCKLMD